MHIDLKIFLLIVSIFFCIFATDVLAGIRIDKLEQQVLQLQEQLQHTSADVNSQLPR